MAYTLSNRRELSDAVSDLRCREGTTLKNIAAYTVAQLNHETKNNPLLATILTWATNKKLDSVVWTALQSNFADKSKFKRPFSIQSAVEHIQALNPEGKAKAAEYVWRAPAFIQTPLKTQLEREPWFAAG